MAVCGGFNSTPGSAAHSLLVNGVVAPEAIELQNDPLGILAPASKLCTSAVVRDLRGRGKHELGCRHSLRAILFVVLLEVQ